MLYIVVYNGVNDKTITRLYVSRPIFVDIGNYNGYGWYIITIQELYEKSFYTLETVFKLIEKEKVIMEKRNSLIKKVVRIIDVILD